MACPWTWTNLRGKNVCCSQSKMKAAGAGAEKMNPPGGERSEEREGMCQVRSAPCEIRFAHKKVLGEALNNY